MEIDCCLKHNMAARCNITLIINTSISPPTTKAKRASAPPDKNICPTVRRL